jgi:hypothetical protein
MCEPTLRARELIQSSRDLTRPTIADRERVEDALRARLGAAVLPLRVRAAPPLACLPGPLVSSVAVGAALMALALLVAFHQGPRAPGSGRAAPMPVAVPVVSAAPAPGGAATSSPVPMPVPVAVSESKHRPSLSSPADDPLSLEIEILVRATTDLLAGRVKEALISLDEHQRRFPNGILTQERRTARAQALCSLGRRSEAQTELAQLAPQSLAVVRAQQYCEETSKAGR